MLFRRLVLSVVFFIFVSNGFALSGEDEKAALMKQLDGFNEYQSLKPGRDWFYLGLEVNYILLNTADLITTFYGLDKGAAEANPVAKHIVKNKPLTILLKGGATGAVLFTLAKVKVRNKPAAYLTLGLLNVVYGLVLRNNIGIVLQL